MYAEEIDHEVEAVRVCEVRAGDVSCGRDGDDRRDWGAYFDDDGPREGVRDVRRF